MEAVEIIIRIQYPIQTKKKKTELKEIIKRTNLDLNDIRLKRLILDIL